MKHAIQSALLNLRNIIKDNDNMEWYAPNKTYKFEMQRYDAYSNLILNGDSNSNYIIEIKILNNIGIEMYKIRMNEIDLVRLVDSLSFYEYETNEEYGASMVFGFNPCNNYNQMGKETRIQVTREPEQKIPQEMYPIIFNKNCDEYRSNHLTIYEYDFNQNTHIDILNIWISDTELDELTFDLYFVGLMDIQLPDDSISTLENMFSRMYGYGPYGFWDPDEDD